MNKAPKPYLLFTIGISVLVLSSSTYGFLNPSLYDAEVFNWQVQTVWQDYANVFLVIPVLILSLIGIHFEIKPSESIWAGTLLYILYTFVIYAFALHFNRFFLFYCASLSLSGWGLAWFGYYTLKAEVSAARSFGGRAKGAAWFLLILSVLFYFLWLGELLPAILQNKAPKTVFDLQLLTNPVHVLDLSFILPSFILGAVLIFKKKNTGLLIGYPLLVFAVLMSLTIAGLEAALLIQNTKGSWMVLIGMVIAALIGLILLFWPSATDSKRAVPI